MAQTLHWPRHHAVEASALAISSSICMKTSSGASVPPRLCGSSDAIKPVLDQRGDHGWRQPPRPLDLVGLARDQRLPAPARVRRGPKPGCLFMRFLALLGFLSGEGAMVVYPPRPIKTGRRMEQADAGPQRFQRARPSTRRSAQSSSRSLRLDATDHPPDAVAAQRDQLSVATEYCDRRRRPFPGATSISSQEQKSVLQIR